MEGEEGRKTSIVRAEWLGWPPRLKGWTVRLDRNDAGARRKGLRSRRMNGTRRTADCNRVVGARCREADRVLGC